MGFDLHPDAVQGVVDAGAEGAMSLEDKVKKVTAPRSVWIMVHAGDPVERTIEARPARQQ